MQDQLAFSGVGHMPQSSRTAATQTAPVKIALVNGEETFRMAMAIHLKSAGFDVFEINEQDTNALADRIIEDSVETVLIDIDQGSDIAHGLIECLDARKAGIPVAFLAQTFNDAAEELALKSGAVEYLVKTRGPTIMAKRIHLLLNGVRANGAEADETELFEIGDLKLRLESHRALWQEHLVALTVTEFKIVRLLAVAHGRGFSYRRIYDVVHGAGFVAGDGPDGFRINVRALIRKIRRKFRDVDAGFSAIENIAGYGYQWRSPDNAETATLTSNDHEPKQGEVCNVIEPLPQSVSENNLDGEDKWTSPLANNSTQAA